MKVKKKKVFVLFVFVTLALSMVPVGSWVYQDGTPEDTKFEKFGPRADKLLIKLYSTPEAEWDALEAGEIDITDWPLTKERYSKYSMPPYNETINVISYGAEFRFFMLDINNNNNSTLPDGSPNPVYPNPTSVKELRQAIAYLTDRGQLATLIGAGFYTPLYTPVPPSMGMYSHPEIGPGGALENLTYPYSRAAAETKLDAGGFVLTNSPDGWRYWDRNSNGVKDAGEDLNLKFFIRSDHVHRRDMGSFIASELEAENVRVSRVYLTIRDARIQVMTNKDFHLYTGDWPLDIDPDYLIDWNSEFYWHPGEPYNYAGVNDPILAAESYWMRYANTYDEALTNAYTFQERFADIAASVPLWSYVGSEAMSRRYTGGTAGVPVTPDDGENIYRGLEWEGVVKIPGYGINNDWSSLNMHPRGFERGDGEHLTIRCGCHVSEMGSLNPLYAIQPDQADSNDNCPLPPYESLLRPDPYNLGELMPWLAENYTISTYEHLIYGTCSEVKFTLRPDATWQDGTPLTTADVSFTLVELDGILRKRGLPPPIWISNVMDVLDFRITDPYNFEVLFNIKSIWALSWVCQQIILPMHVWKPICESGDPTGFAPDPNMIGSGPWRFVEYVANSHVLFIANKPGGIVHGIESPVGYFHCLPFRTEAFIIEPPELAHSHRIPLAANYTFGGCFYNEFAVVPMENVSFYVNFTIPGFPSFIFNETLTVPPATEKGELDWETKDEIIKGKVTSKKELRAQLVKEDCAWKLKVFVREKFHVQEDIVHRITNYITKNGKRIAETEPIELVLKKCTRWHTDTEIFVWRIPWRCEPIEPKNPIYAVWWATIPEDITGTTLYDDIGLPGYPYKSQLPSPDFKVDMKDVYQAARAFGSHPGHERWGMGIADLNNDYKIDMRDIFYIAKNFGWTG